VSPDISLCFFRVLQEALHNSAKHSGVRHFEVRLWGTSDEIHLTVRDSGAGFDREETKESRGLGLISMEERLKLLKGTLSIDTQPKRGYHDPCSRAFQGGKRSHAYRRLKTLEREISPLPLAAIREPHRGGEAWELAYRQARLERDPPIQH
jgi:Histidine kinase-, DNA gyrase B-, and HSP90-like ATPase